MTSGLLSVAFLNLDSSLFFLSTPTFYFGRLELIPETVELGEVLVNIVLVINYANVLLIVRTSLISPVERSCDNEFTINYSKLVMHMVRGFKIYTNRDASVS